MKQLDQLAKQLRDLGWQHVETACGVVEVLLCWITRDGKSEVWWSTFTIDCESTIYLLRVCSPATPITKMAKVQKLYDEGRIADVFPDHLYEIKDPHQTLFALLEHIHTSTKEEKHLTYHDDYKPPCRVKYSGKR